MPQITSGDITMEYDLLGPAEAPALVLIRGLGTQMIEWSPILLEALQAAGMRVLIFDNRDAGLSTKVRGDYSLHDMAGDVLGLMDALDIKRAAIFGISLGGMIAQHVALRAPERVTALFPVMTSSGHPDLPRPAPPILARLQASPAGRAAIIAFDAESRAIFGSPGWPQPWAEREAAATAAHDRCHCPEGVSRQMRAVIADGDRTARLASIRVPTLVIHGVDDPLIPLAAGEQLAAAIPGARLERIAGMGHNLPDALAPILARLVSGFLAD